MAYCCVPQCTSKWTRCSGVSFHEIPCKTDERELWISAISRADWVPNSTSNYSRVCSKHFLETDFSPGLKTRRLRPGTIPTIFPWIKSKKIKTRNKDNFSNGDSQITNKFLPNVPKHDGVSYNESVNNDSDKKFVIVNTNGLGSSSHLIEYECEISSTVQTPAATKTLFERDDCVEKVDCIQVLVHEQNEVVNKGVQVSCKELPIPERRKWARKCRDLRKRVNIIQAKYDNCAKELNDIKSDGNLKSFLSVIEQAKEKDVSAMFIFDQVRNFVRSRPVWTENTIRHCVVLRKLSTKAYEHIRTENVLKLPSRNTLNSYTKVLCGKTDVNCCLEKNPVEGEFASTQGTACLFFSDDFIGTEEVIIPKIN